MTHEQYITDKAKLDELNKAIDAAPMNAKPVFAGIVRLHDRVKRYERDQRRNEKNLSVQ